MTEGPGLVGSLLVGRDVREGAGVRHRLPLIGVNHIEGHIHAVVLEAAAAGQPIEYPALALVVSGGHTHLFEVGEGFEYRLLGRTRDDAAGEAFDKVAKLLGFGYPGGPVIDSLAPYGDPRAVRFTLARMKGNPLDFSFSGLKTAVLRWTQAHEMDEELAARRALLKRDAAARRWSSGSPVTPQRTRDLLAAFQYTLIQELMQADHRGRPDEIGARTVIVSGGVACNSGLRGRGAGRAAALPGLFPTPGLSTDNAAMIAAAAFRKLRRGEVDDFTLRAQANLALA